MGFLGGVLRLQPDCHACKQILAFRSLHTPKPHPSHSPNPQILGRNPATNFVPDAGHTIAAHEAAVGDEGAAAGARGAGTRISKAKARAREPEIGDMKRAMAALYVKIRKAEGDLELQSIRRSSAVGAGEEEEEAAAKELEARASLLKDAVEKLLACDGGGEAAGTEIEGVGQSDVELAGEALGATAIKVRITSKLGSHCSVSRECRSAIAQRLIRTKNSEGRLSVCWYRVSLAHP